MTLEFEERDLKLAAYSKGDHPLDLFLKGDVETRGDVILNHPDVIGFVYLNDDIITKAFLPKKVINFKATKDANKKVIVAVSGDTEEYTPFCVPEKLSSTMGFILRISPSFQRALRQFLLGSF